MTEVLRYAAFTDDPSGGNPAGIVLDATGLDADTMQALAAEVGYAETAFLLAESERAYAIRYFSPSVEVPFCGHATIATGVALGERLGAGRFLLSTKVGEVPVDVEAEGGGYRATLTSVEPELREISDDDLAALLSTLRWPASGLDSALPPRIAFAGAWHPIIAAASRARLADLDYDYDGLLDLMVGKDWQTIQLVWRETSTLFHVRDPGPPAGLVEDFATGSAAAAFGHYLRETGLVDVPARVTLTQGVDLGRPSILTVEIGTEPGIRVSGHAVAIVT